MFDNSLLRQWRQDGNVERCNSIKTQERMLLWNLKQTLVNKNMHRYNISQQLKYYLCTCFWRKIIPKSDIVVANNRYSSVSVQSYNSKSFGQHEWRLRSIQVLPFLNSEVIYFCKVMILCRLMWIIEIVFVKGSFSYLKCAHKLWKCEYEKT